MRRTKTKKKSKTNDQPDFILKMKSRDRDKKGSAKIGAGWTNSAGGISIKLNMGVCIDHRDSEDYIFTLWPNDDSDYEEEEEIFEDY